MNNAYDEIRNALVVAKLANDASDEYASRMAQLIEGRLRKVSPHILKRLKRELRDHNIHTGQWK
jgi:hypothetical protein